MLRQPVLQLASVAFCALLLSRSRQGSLQRAVALRSKEGTAAPGAWCQACKLRCRRCFGCLQAGLQRLQHSHCIQLLVQRHQAPAAAAAAAAGPAECTAGRVSCRGTAAAGIAAAASVFSQHRQEACRHGTPLATCKLVHQSRQLRLRHHLLGWKARWKGGVGRHHGAAAVLRRRRRRRRLQGRTVYRRWSPHDLPKARSLTGKSNCSFSYAACARRCGGLGWEAAACASSSAAMSWAAKPSTGMLPGLQGSGSERGCTVSACSRPPGCLQAARSALFQFRSRDRQSNWSLPHAWPLESLAQGRPRAERPTPFTQHTVPQHGPDPQ